MAQDYNVQERARMAQGYNVQERARVAHYYIYTALAWQNGSVLYTALALQNGSFIMRDRMAQNYNEWLSVIHRVGVTEWLKTTIACRATTQLVNPGRSFNIPAASKRNSSASSSNS